MSKKKSGFTLVELLVVIAIIGILIGLLLPAVQAVRQAARRTQCSNNLRQWALGSINYEGVFKTLPGSHFSGPIGTTAYTSDTGWMVAVLPYVEQQNLYDQFELRVWAFAPINSRAASFRIDINQCPSADEAVVLTNVSEFFGGGAAQGTAALTGDYSGNGGFIEGGQPTLRTSKKQGTVPTFVGGVTPQKVTLASIRDGQSNTLYMWDSSSADWYYHQNNQLERDTWENFMNSQNPVLLLDENAPTFFNSSPASSPYFAGWAGIRSFPARLWDNDGLTWGPGGESALNRTNAYGSPFSFHPNVVMTALADGSVRPMQDSIRWSVFASLCSRFGGEVVEVP